MCLALTLSTVSCGEQRPTTDERLDGPWTGTEQDSAGVRIVSNPSFGTWTDETRWTVEKDLSIGVVDEPPEYQFGRIVDVDAGSEERIYVLDAQAAEVRVFGPEGAHLFSFGGAGEGPGELSRQPPGPRAILTTSGEDIFVPDQCNGRVNRFGAEGEILGSFPIRMEQGLSVGWFTTPGGDYVSHHASPAWNGLLRIRPDGQVIDTIMEFEVAAPGIYAEGRREALEHAAVWTILTDGRVASGISDRSRIEIRGAEGELEMVLKRQAEDAALSRGDQQRFLDRLGEIWAQMLRARGEQEASIESQIRQIPHVYTAPTHRPAFTGLAAGPRGTLWIRRALPLDSMTSAVLDGFRRPLQEFWAPTWDVFSEDGQLLGEVAMPARFTLHKIRGSRIYGVERDELGVQRVARLRIRLP
jgi:hypothetical protein